MGFDTLLGNTRLKENLISSLNRGHISHFYLISGPAGSGKHTLARLLSAAILCSGEDKPCGRCVPCRKVMENLHPDVITVEDPEHKTVAVKIVRQFREDVFVLPNESDYKIYIFPQELGVEGQNALLKVLEEPPKYGVFLLLTDNPEKILPTVRSRCTELKLQALPEALLKAPCNRIFPMPAARTFWPPWCAAAAIWVRPGSFCRKAPPRRPRPWTSSRRFPPEIPSCWCRLWLPWKNGNGTSWLKFWGTGWKFWKPPLPAAAADRPCLPLPGGWPPDAAAGISTAGFSSCAKPGTTP